MCRANFLTQVDKPIIAATVAFPRLEIGQEIPFLLDTGADSTCVTQLSAADGGFHPTQLPDSVEMETEVMTGVGGDCKSYFLEEPTLLAFEDHSEDRERYSLHIEYLPGISVSEGVPSNLLGRDVLHRFDMDYRPSENSVELVRDDYADGRYQCITSPDEISSSLFDYET